MATNKTNQRAATAAAKEAKAEAAATQAYLNIAEIKDGVVILKDGTMRAVLMTSAINFALKSGGEQDSIIYGYQRFLNSLTFPVQILVQSRQLDLDYYLAKLQKRADEEQIELVKLQILEYSEFINRLISVTNIMDKRFFVVVPFYPQGTEQLKGIAKLFATKKPLNEEAKEKEDSFVKSKVQLMQRVEQIASGLGAMGLRAATLNSEELVELFYSIYNPSTAVKQRLVNVDELTAATIEGVGSPDAGGQLLRHHVAARLVDETPEPPVATEPVAATGPEPAVSEPAPEPEPAQTVAPADQGPE